MSTSTPVDSSRTVTIQDSQPVPDNAQAGSIPGVLRLRGGPSSRPRVLWREDVVDNENMNKKSSKSASRSFIKSVLLTDVSQFAVSTIKPDNSGNLHPTSLRLMMNQTVVLLEAVPTAHM